MFYVYAAIVMSPKQDRVIIRLKHYIKLNITEWEKKLLFSILESRDVSKEAKHDTVKLFRDRDLKSYQNISSFPILGKDGWLKTTPGVHVFYPLVHHNDIISKNIYGLVWGSQTFSRYLIFFDIMGVKTISKDRSLHFIWCLMIN